MAVSEGKVITNSSVSGFVSTGGNDTITGGKDFTGAVSVLDATFEIRDEADPTKKAVFQASSISTGTTRTFTLPNTTGTLVLTNQTTTTLGSVTSAQTLNIGAGVTSTGNTKTANIATAGASGSTTDVNIGSATAGALGTTTINSPTVAFGATVTAINLPDAATFLVDNADATKKLQFELSGITTATTRTLTAPNASGTIQLLSGTQTVAADNTHTGEQIFRDNKFTLSDNIDTTKTATFQLSGITTATNRSFVFPDIGSATFIMDAGAQTVGGVKTFSVPPAITTSTVAGLPAATTAGKLAFVTDSTVTHAGNGGAIVAGTGANFCPVYSDGTNWRIM